MESLIVEISLLMAFSSVIPVVILLVQFILVGLHACRNHYAKCKPFTPHVAVIVPAWNEGEVIGNTVDALLDIDYPKTALRVYVVDDGSTDDTPAVLKSKEKQYPGNVFHIRRENGGQGKAHTINYGLKTILAQDKLLEAVLILDADVLLKKDTLRKMTRHLADGKVGAVTAYVKEGSHSPNLISNFIAYEYIGAQAAARRAQNFLGILSCLSGGAQLHSRENLQAIGAEIDASTLAEDTYTTFKTQLLQRQAIFDGNAVVMAEEPDNIYALWKQRFRWARGNVQITRAFRKLWFNPFSQFGWGGVIFSLIWFSILLMPFFMIISSAGLVSLYFLNYDLAWHSLHFLAWSSAVAYLFMTFYSFLIDTTTAKRAWFAGIMFPGLISLIILTVSINPPFFERQIDALIAVHLQSHIHHFFSLFSYLWVSLCLFFAWLLYRLDRAGLPKKLSQILLLIIGYGPLLCAITLAAFIAEIANATIRWDKTEKVGKVGKAAHREDFQEEVLNFEQQQKKDILFERKLLRREIGILILITAVLILLRYYLV